MDGSTVEYASQTAPVRPGGIIIPWYYTKHAPPQGKETKDDDDNEALGFQKSTTARRKRDQNAKGRGKQPLSGQRREAGKKAMLLSPIRIQVKGDEELQELQDERELVKQSSRVVQPFDRAQGDVDPVHLTCIPRSSSTPEHFWIADSNTVEIAGIKPTLTMEGTKKSSITHTNVAFHSNPTRIASKDALVRLQASPSKIAPAKSNEENVNRRLENKPGKDEVRHHAENASFDPRGVQQFHNVHGLNASWVQRIEECLQKREQLIKKKKRALSTIHVLRERLRLEQDTYTQLYPEVSQLKETLRQLKLGLQTLSHEQLIRSTEIATLASQKKSERELAKKKLDRKKEEWQSLQHDLQLAKENLSTFADLDGNLKESASRLQRYENELKTQQQTNQEEKLGFNINLQQLHAQQIQADLELKLLEDTLSVQDGENAHMKGMVQQLSHSMLHPSQGIHHPRLSSHSTTFQCPTQHLTTTHSRPPGFLSPLPTTQKTSFLSPSFSLKEKPTRLS